MAPAALILSRVGRASWPAADPTIAPTEAAASQTAARRIPANPVPLIDLPLARADRTDGFSDAAMVPVAVVSGNGTLVPFSDLHDHVRRDGLRGGAALSLHCTSSFTLALPDLAKPRSSAASRETSITVELF